MKLWPFKIFLEDKVSKRISALSIAVLVLAGTCVGISSASAALPYKACKPAKAKATIGKLSYTCAKNPAGTSTALVWVSKHCLDASANYKSAVSITASNTATTTAAVNAAKRSITVNERQLASAQKNVDTWSKNMLRYPKNPTETEKKQIATVQEGIDRNKQRIADAQANIASLQAQMASATEQGTKNAAGLEAIKTSVTTSCK